MDVSDSSSGRLTSNMFTANISQDSSTIEKKQTNKKPGSSFLEQKNSSSWGRKMGN